MQNITIIAMGKVQKGFQLDGCNEYIKRLKTMCNLKIVQLEDVQLAEKNLNDTLIQKTLDREADEIIKNIPIIHKLFITRLLFFFFPASI